MLPLEHSAILQYFWPTAIGPENQTGETLPKSTPTCDFMDKYGKYYDKSVVSKGVSFLKKDLYKIIVT